MRGHASAMDLATAASYSKSKRITVVHASVPGRLRLRVEELIGRPELGAAVCRRLNAWDGIEDVQVNAVTGSVLICFRPRAVGADQIKRALRAALRTRAPQPGAPMSDRSNFKSQRTKNATLPFLRRL